jgi:hypothetical protein
MVLAMWSGDQRKNAGGPERAALTVATLPVFPRCRFSETEVQAIFRGLNIELTDFAPQTSQQFPASRPDRPGLAAASGTDTDIHIGVVCDVCINSRRYLRSRRR